MAKSKEGILGIGRERGKSPKKLPIVSTGKWANNEIVEKSISATNDPGILVESFPTILGQSAITNTVPAAIKND